MASAWKCTNCGTTNSWGMSFYGSPHCVAHKVYGKSEYHPKQEKQIGVRDAVKHTRETCRTIGR